MSKLQKPNLKTFTFYRGDTIDFDVDTLVSLVDYEALQAENDKLVKTAMANAALLTKLVDEREALANSTEKTQGIS